MITLLPKMTLSVLVQQFLIPFVSIPATMCETIRYIVLDFNRKLHLHLTGSTATDHLGNLADEYRTIAEIVSTLNECVSTYLYFVHCSILPIITMLVYMLCRSSALNEYELGIIILLVEVSVVAVVNIWFPTMLNEEVSMNMS